MSFARHLHTLLRQKQQANRDLLNFMRPLDAAAHPQEHHYAIRILNHALVVDQIFQAHLQGKAHPFTATNTTDTPTLTDLTQAIAKTDAWYADYSASIGTDALAQILDFVFTDGQTGHMTRGEMLLHVATHNAYLRGGAGRALSIYNQTLPKDGLAAFVATQVRNFAQNPAVTGHL